jgi:hypothetical protein
MHPDRLHPFDLPIQRILVDLETHLPPWMKLVSQSNESAFTRLSNEIAALADLVSPTSKERLVRKDIIHRLQVQVRKIWPTATVVPIGSYAQEIYTSSRYSSLDVIDSVTWICLCVYRISLNLWRIWKCCIMLSIQVPSLVLEHSTLFVAPVFPSSNTSTLAAQVFSSNERSNEASKSMYR